MRAHLIIDLVSGAVELQTDTDPKPARPARGPDKKPRKRAGRRRTQAQAVKVSTETRIKEKPNE